KPGLQFEQQHSWIPDLHVSYHVGVYGFSLWLVGLTVIAMAATTCYGYWVGRDRSRAYFGLMLFLTGATVGVFTSQDLLLFYAFLVASPIKPPLFPLHGWLPDTYREAPPEVAAVLSGVIAKAGLYGMLRIAITKFPEPTSYYRTGILAIAAITLVYGSLLA